MKKLVITLTYLILISFSGNAQSNVDFNEMIGFGCGFAGEQSKPVQKVSKLIEKENYAAIVQLFDSDNNAEKFLAVVVCEKLSELNKLILTIEVKEKISIAYNSSDLVSVCSGCSYWNQLTLTKMLQNGNPMRISANFWLEHLFGNE